MNKKNKHNCFVKNDANAVIKDISVKVVRLEDDSKLLIWIANNLKTHFDLKKLKQQITDTTQQKGKKVAREKSKLKQGLLNKNLAKMQKYNVACQRYKSDKILSSVSSKIESDGSISAHKLVEKEYTNDKSTYEESCNGRIPSISNLSFDCTEELRSKSCSQNKCSQKQIKCCVNNPSSVPRPKEDQSDVKDHKSVEFSEKEIKNVSVSMDVEESLSLITRLTGCSVNPLKVKLLPLSSADVSEKIECGIIENEPEKSSIMETSSSLSPMHTITSKVSKTNYESDCKETRNSDVRTMYDLMNDFFAILPSWNLHILSDTNTFCIGQVSRNKFGIPYLSKSIELDDNFNAKVYVYQQHRQEFDGIYDSEDMVKALIYKVNHH